MMTTKVFQRVLAIFLVVAAIFLANGLNNVANAARVQIYDNSVENLLDYIVKVGNEYNFTTRGTHYYTGKDGFKYCESYFGDSDKNRIVFQVNNNGAVSSGWVIFPRATMSGKNNEAGGKIGSLLVCAICDRAGMSEEQIHNFGDEMENWIDNWISNHKSGELPNKTFSIWCAKSKRYININVFADSSYDFVNFHIYAHI